MSNAVNYYEELGLNKEMSIDEISVKLNQLETLWNQRLFSEPEKATDILSLISKARTVFASVEAKTKYDEELNSIDSNEKCATDSEFDSFFEQAKSFYQAKEYDLARSSIEKALGYIGKGNESSSVYSFASEVYLANELYDMSIKYINSAITIDSKNAMLYYSKGLVYVEWINRIARQNIDNISNGKTTVEIDKGLYEKGRKCFEFAMTLAHENSDSVLEGKAAGYLSICMMRCDNPNYNMIKEIAEKAVSLGDETGEGKSALALISNMEKEEAKKKKRDSIRSMMLSESIPSTSVYYLDYYSEVYNFNSIKEEGEIIGTCFWEIVVKAMSSYGIQFSDFIGGIYRSFQEAADYRRYKYHGFIMYYLAKPGYPELSPQDQQIQVYLTSDNKFVVDFRKSKILAYNTNNELALKIMDMAIDEGYVNEDAMILSEETINAEKREKERKLREADTKAFNLEIAPERARISEKYNSLRDQLIQEKNERIANAKDEDFRKNEILNEINSLEVQLKSLGLFDFKKKGKLKEEIENKKRSMDAIISSDKIEKLYRDKIEVLSRQETDDVASAVARLKKKFPYASV